MPSLFWHLYEESLREGKPNLYRQLEASGELTSHLDEVAKAAYATFDSILAALRKQSPEPTSLREKAQHLQTLASQATEMVLDAILIRHDDPMPDEYRNDDSEAANR